MELQDFLTKRNKSYHSFRTQNFQNDGYQTYDSSSPLAGNINWANLINGIRNNKKIRNLLIIAVVIVLAIIIGLIAILLPLIVKIFDYLTTVGISGLIDAALKFVNDLLGVSK
jgi:type IV secretory pathway component VirB8